MCFSCGMKYVRAGAGREGHKRATRGGVGVRQGRHRALACLTNENGQGVDAGGCLRSPLDSTGHAPRAAISPISWRGHGTMGKVKNLEAKKKAAKVFAAAGGGGTKVRGWRAPSSVQQSPGISGRRCPVRGSFVA